MGICLVVVTNPEKTVPTIGAASPLPARFSLLNELQEALNRRASATRERFKRMIKHIVMLLTQVPRGCDTLAIFSGALHFICQSQFSTIISAIASSIA